MSANIKKYISKCPQYILIH